ncbi:MAG: hypothetical protein SO170_00305 [Butyribacter sp.]|nr:hypothetical protein [Butyribacter sp.]
MSMEFQTILELIQVCLAYVFSVYCVPCVVFHNYLRNKTLSSKFIISTLIGNFYIINVVFVIFLFHIPGRISLYLFTILPVILGWIKINRPRIRRYFSLLATAFSRLFLGEAKIRTVLSVLFYQPKKILRKTRHNIFSHLKHHFVEWVMMGGLLAFDVWYYSYQTVTKYVYGASDLVVHHEWINQMDEGVIFYHGIYPFGFHNTVYFLHNFFGLEILSILRVFNVVIMLYVYIMLYLLLRKVCRSRYLPIFGVFLFTLPHIFNFQGTMRYQWSLPQEFAMVFLYPCAYFLIQFFERKKQELQTEKELAKQKKLYTWVAQYFVRPSTRSLIFCGISFSLTLAIHFYITIIAVFLMLAIFLAYFPIGFHYRYFLPIATAAILSVCAAVLPMGAGYLQGTDIEGSLRWALSAMSSGEEQEEETVQETPAPETKKQNDAKNNTITPKLNTSPDVSSDMTPGSAPVEEKNIGERILDTVSQKWDTICHYSVAAFQFAKTKLLHFNKAAKDVLLNVYDLPEIILPILISLEILFVFLFLAIIIRKLFYYRNQFGICIYMFFMIMLMCAPDFSLPSVMDNARARLFLTYATPLYIACAVDIIYVILCKPFRYHRITEILPIGLTLALTYLTITNNLVKPLNILYALQLPGEMKCNYQIMDEYPDKTWTLVTTTNTYSQVRQHGWHYEVCTFLEKMDHYTKNKQITIPTKYVFFYIEKYPIDYGSFNLVTEPVNNIGYVSESAARSEAFYSGGDVYTATNRYILESKLFYWAKAYEKKYPREFQVYYEDEQFICYRIIQNEYHLYNFAIDYNYNN